MQTPSTTLGWLRQWARRRLAICGAAMCGPAICVAIAVSSALCSLPVSAVELRWCLDHFPHYHEFNQDNRHPSGPSVELMQHVARTAKFRLVILPKTPAARCLKQMATGEVDLMVNLVYTPERAATMHLIRLSSKTPDSIVMRHDDPADYRQLATWRFARIAVVRGYRYEAPAQQYLRQVPATRQVEVADLLAGLQMLQKQRADLLLAPHLPVQDVLQQFDAQAFRWQRSPLTSDQSASIYLAVSKHTAHPELVPQLEAAVAQAIADGTVARLFPRAAQRSSP